MAAARIQWWALTLSAYEYTIACRPERDLANADALSRLPLDCQVQVPLPGELLLLWEHLNTSSPVMAEQIRTWTDRDPLLSRIKTFILQGWPYISRK